MDSGGKTMDYRQIKKQANEILKNKAAECSYIEYKASEQQLDRILKTILASFVMIIPALIIHHFVPFNFDNRLLGLLIMAALGLIMMIIYYFVSTLLKLPQEIFGIEDISIKKLLKRFRA